MTALLLDTNAYFRLAKSFHPLLGKAVHGLGTSPSATLCVTTEVDREFSANPRLVSKFHWVAEVEYQANRRQNVVKVTGTERSQIDSRRKFIQFGANGSAAEFATRRLKRPSPTDCLILAYGDVLGIDVISDDAGMAFTAATIMKLKFRVLGSLDVLHALHKSGQISLQQIKTVAQFLQYEDDLPGSWQRDGPKLFGEKLV